MGRIGADEAAARLAGVERHDPLHGIAAPADLRELAEGGECFAIEGEAASAVYVLSVVGGLVWVNAVKGGGRLDVARVLDGVITAQAEGARALGCQTARPGLVEKLQREGWQVAGWLLRKDLPHAD